MWGANGKKEVGDAGREMEMRGGRGEERTIGKKGGKENEENFARAAPRREGGR